MVSLNSREVLPLTGEKLSYFLRTFSHGNMNGLAGQ